VRGLGNEIPASFPDRNNDSAVDAHGWAEPGTSLRINGSETPVAADGLFLAHVPAAKDGTITLEAVRGKDRKRIVRSFRLQFEPARP